MPLFKMDATSARAISPSSIDASSDETSWDETPSDEECPNCSSPMSAEWPDLTALEDRIYPQSEHCLKAADSGCPWCRIVAAVLIDATEKRCVVGPKKETFAVNLLRNHDRFLLILKDTQYGLEEKDDYVAIYEAGEQPLLPVRAIDLLKF